MSQEQKLLTLLSMRFKIPMSQGILIVEEWLKENPQSNYEELLTIVKKEGYGCSLIARYYLFGNLQLVKSA